MRVRVVVTARVRVRPRVRARARVVGEHREEGVRSAALLVHEGGAGGAAGGAGLEALEHALARVHAVLPHAEHEDVARAVLADRDRLGRRARVQQVLDLVRVRVSGQG